MIALGLAAAACAQTSAEPVFRPHFRTSRLAPAVDAATVPPFETPASLACLYGLVVNVVPGCPVRGTIELPTGGSGIIAIVNAFDYPSAQHDLNVFSRQFGVPECNDDNPCFRKVFATGMPPQVDSLWAANASGMIEYAHAFAPGAHIVLVEAASASLKDLLTGVRVANSIIANSPGGKGMLLMPFGGPESPADKTFDEFLHTPGVIYISGNEGAPNFLEYPGTSPFVLTLGGTAVVRDDQGMFVTEIASTFWAGDTSMNEPRPAFQDVIQNIVHGRRGVPDVAFGSDPIHGAEIYFDSVPFGPISGWQFTGNVGFGEAAWGAILTLANSGAMSTQEELQLLYSHLGDSSTMRDIKHGEALGVKATAGWDFLTGIGVPVGLGGK